MPVPALLTAKDAAIGYAPIALVTITFNDGSVLRVSKHKPTSAATLTYGGNTYEPRLLNEDLSGIAAQSDNGADAPPTLTLRLADADAYLMRNYELAKGFRGAKVRAVLVFGDVVTNEYSADSREVFSGTVMSAPQVTDTVLSITATNKLNMSAQFFPILPVQPSCPLLFPKDAAERDIAWGDDTGRWCPYNPGTGSGFRGNLNGGSPFTACDFTKAACEQRGMYSTDSSGRQTGAFAGIQWSPQGTGVFRDYRTGNRFEAAASGNEARYGDYFPMLYGTAWVDGLILDTVPDGNFTRWQVIVCDGEVENILRVVVGSYDVPHTFDDTVLAGVPAGVSNATEASKSGWWKAINNGSRLGRANQEAGYGGQGDPFGGKTAIVVVVPNKVAQGGTPRIRVLAKGGKCRVYSAPGTYTHAFTSNPDWHMLDLMRRAGWDVDSDIAISEFIDGAAVCDATIPYVDRYGSIVSHKRYESGFVLRQRRSLADILRSHRVGTKSILRPT